MRALPAAAALAIALVACGSGADTTRLGPAAPAASHGASPSATQPIDLSDMMGLYATQTVFVADTEKISAITLLNHFTRYTIPTQGKAQVAADAYGSFGTPTASSTAWLYVLDGLETTAPARLRTFDLATGTERASRADITGVAFTQRALATAVDGRVLVLKADARHAWVDAYEPLTLKPQGALFEKAGCGDRLLASGSRIAIVCLATGQVAVDDLRGGGAFAIDGALPHLAGAAMADDGTIWVATSDRQLAAIPFAAVALQKLQWPTAWTGTVLPDSVAVANGADSVVFAQTDTDGSWLRVLASNVVAPRMSLRLAGRTEGAPQFGVVVLAPFAYFASGGDVRHVELSTGMLETMTTVGQGATVVAVVDR